MRHRRTRLGLLLLTLALGSANACSSQSEGQRCDKLSGNDDCESGLVCTTYTQTTTPTTDGDAGAVKAVGTYTASVCCPAPDSRVAATTAACQSLSTGAGTDEETGGAGTGGSDTGGTGGSDTGGTGGSDTGGTGGSDTGGTGGAPGIDAGPEAGPDAAAEAGS